jgi:hypothetical protein
LFDIEFEEFGDGEEEVVDFFEKVLYIQMQ